MKKQSLGGLFLNNFFKFFKKNIVVFLILIVTIGYLIINNLSYFNTHKDLVVDKELVSFSANTKPYVYSTYNNTFYISTLVDTKLIDSTGSEKWAHSSMYTNPVLTSKDEYIAIWNDKTSGNVDVFNQKGHCYQVQISNTILDVSINKNGYLAVLSKENDDKGYSLNVFDDKGSSIMTRLADDANLFPVSVAINDDNRIIAVSEIDTNNISAGSFVTLSYVNSKDNVNGETIFSGTPYTDEIIPKIEFSGSNLITYSKDKIHVLLVANDTTKEVATINFTNEILFTTIVDNKYIVVNLGNELANSSESANSVIFYSFNGNKVSTTQLDSKISNMTPAKNSVIITSGRKVTKLNSNGNESYEYIHNRDLQNAYYIGNKVPLIIAETDKLISLTDK